MELYPEYLDELKCWTKSNNHWMRRGAAGSLIILAKLRKYFDTVLQIADLLFTGEIGMVRKERVWLLKKAGRKHQEEGFDYI